MHNIIVISGPSGCGKSTLLRRLLDEFRGLNFSVSHTTRCPRETEIDGRDYHFVSPGRFQEMIERGEFAEWARVHHHLYGTSWNEIREKSTEGRNLILDVDVQGARNIRNKFAEATSVFISPPSLGELEKRLIGRERQIDEDTRNRLNDAASELKEAGQYDYIIINDELDQAYDALRGIFIAFTHATVRIGGEIGRILDGRK